MRDSAGREPFLTRWANRDTVAGAVGSIIFSYGITTGAGISVIGVDASTVGAGVSDGTGIISVVALPTEASGVGVGEGVL